MQKKICNKCKDEKELSEFNKRGKYYQPWCRKCMNENAKEHYLKNKQSYLDKNERLRKIIIDYVRNLKKQSSCKCGENHPATLQFHHRNPEDKSFELASIYSNGYGLETIKKEIEKCDILCANCHAKLHYKP